MARGNRELVRFAYETFNRDDFEQARTIMHPDVHWYSSGAFPGLDPLYVGPDRVHEWWRAIREPFESFTVAIERELEVGDSVVLLVRFDAVGRESGAMVQLPFGQLFRFRDGLIVEFASFESWEDAVAAARKWSDQVLPSGEGRAEHG